MPMIKQVIKGPLVEAQEEKALWKACAIRQTAVLPLTVDPVVRSNAGQDIEFLERCI